LIHWRYESTFRAEDTYIGPSDRCWAVDAAEKNGKYYYYFSNGNQDTGVAMAELPGDPFYDALDSPLLENNTTPGLQYDPTVFVEDTGDAYLLWGTVEGEGYFIAKLAENMISLAEKLRWILIDGGAARDDKNFLHKKMEYIICPGDLSTLLQRIYMDRIPIGETWAYRKITVPSFPGTDRTFMPFFIGRQVSAISIIRKTEKCRRTHRLQSTVLGFTTVIGIRSRRNGLWRENSYRKK